MYTEVGGSDSAEFPCPYVDCGGEFDTWGSDVGAYDGHVIAGLCPHCKRPIEVETQITYVARPQGEAEDVEWRAADEPMQQPETT